MQVSENAYSSRMRRPSRSLLTFDVYENGRNHPRCPTQPQPPLLPGNRRGDHMPAGDTALAAVEREVLAAAHLGTEVYLIEPAARGRDAQRSSSSW